MLTLRVPQRAWLIRSAVMQLCCSALILGDIHSEPAPLYSASVTLKALRHPRGALDALRYLHTLPPSDLKTLSSEALLVELERLALHEERSLQVRLWSVQLLARLQAPRPALQSLVADVPKGASPTQSACLTTLARASALALRGLARPDLLEEGLQHPDPEVRAHAAASGAAPGQLCQVVTSDPWPEVRYEAVQGLMKVGGAQALCLRAVLKDQSADVQERGAYALGSLSLDAHWSPSDNERVTIIKSLRALAGDPRAPLPSRASAFVSLGRWGDLGPSEQVLKTHLTKGGITPLAIASVQAIASSSATLEERTAKLVVVLEQSGSLEVRLRAASALSQLGAQGATRALLRAADRLGGREGARYLKLVKERAERAETKEQPTSALPQVDPLVPPLVDEDRLGL